jgi:hypothetical protein
MTGKSIVHIFVPRFCFPLFIDGGSRNLKSRQPPTHLSRWPVEFPKTTEPALRAPKPSPSLFPMCVITSFIMHKSGRQARNGFGFFVQDGYQSPFGLPRRNTLDGIPRPWRVYEDLLCGLCDLERSFTHVASRSRYPGANLPKSHASPVPGTTRRS